ncbi:MAG: substrate-binding domain-containing protein, partial [Candidatus Nanopelagicales bacterium]
MARAFTGRRMAVVASAGVLALGLAACGGSSDSGSSDSAAPETSAAPAPDGEPVKVTLITKDSTNPFFVAMQEGAKEAAAAQGVDLTVGSGKAEGDDQGQIDLIEQAIARGDAGILITPISTNVNAAIEKARAAGLYVIALDTPTDPPDVVDITFATDNCLAGEAIGQWTAGWLNGEKATIARLVIFNDRMVSVDYCRDNGFLRGMGIDIADLTVMGDEAESGTYTTGAGGEYEWVCLEATGANQEGGRAGME